MTCFAYNSLCTLYKSFVGLSNSIFRLYALQLYTILQKHDCIDGLDFIQFDWNENDLGNFISMAERFKGF